MNKTVLFLLFTYSIFWITAKGDSYRDEPKRVLVIGLDTLQFSSNIFYIDELAHYNNVDVEAVVQLYNTMLMQALRDFTDNDYRFVTADSADKAAVHSMSVFVDIKNDFGKEFIGIAAGEGQGQVLIDLMEKHHADYVLSINAYQIYHKDPPEFVRYDIRAEHIIHYDIFDTALTNIYGGQAPLTSYAVEALFMNTHYRQFVRSITLWLAAHEGSLMNNKTIVENLKLLRDEEYVDASLLCLSLAFDGPYGLIGGSYSRLIGRNFEANAGLGYDFSGLKIGVGSNLYLSNVFKRKLKPLIGLNYSFVTGNTFELGSRTNDYGIQLDPDDVSNFKIYADHILHLQGGLSYWMENSILTLSVGYSYPFLGRKPGLVFGKESVGRMNFVEALNPGGLDVSVRYSFFINERFLYRFW